MVSNRREKYHYILRISKYFYIYRIQTNKCTTWGCRKYDRITNAWNGRLFPETCHINH